MRCKGRSRTSTCGININSYSNNIIYMLNNYNYNNNNNNNNNLVFTTVWELMRNGSEDEFLGLN